MRSVKVILWVLIVSVMAILLWNYRGKSDNELPRKSLAVIEYGTLYKMLIKQNDAPYMGRNGGYDGYQQSYNIHLQAGFFYVFETATHWQDVAVDLVENGKQLGHEDCGWPARCRFFVEADRDIWGILRVTGLDSKENHPFTVEVRQTKEHYDYGVPSPRTANIHSGELSLIENDGRYTGTLYRSDAPVYKHGEGVSQDYRINLKKEQKIVIKANSTAGDLGLGLYGPTRRYAQAFSKNPKSGVCIEANAPVDGEYILRVMTNELNTQKYMNFTIELSRGDSGLIGCKM